MKSIAKLAVLFVGFILVVLNFSGTESKFKCNGEALINGKSQKSSVFIKLHEYRWWVGLWNDSDGSIWLEAPKVTLAYFDNLNDSGNQIQIYERDNLRGYFSKLSNTLEIHDPDISFTGTCKAIEK